MNSTRSPQSKRLINAVCGLVLLCVLGGCVLLLARIGHGIPCVLYQITGFKCPGCGTTRMLLSLAAGDIPGALGHNAAVLLQLPFGVYLAIRYTWRYVKTGTHRFTKGEQRMAWVIAAFLLLFGICRNLAVFLNPG